MRFDILDEYSTLVPFGSQSLEDTMTDITTTAPITFRRLTFSFVRFPKLNIGTAFAATLEDIRRVFALAYVQPYRLGRSQSPVVLEGSEKGRDPSW